MGGAIGGHQGPPPPGGRPDRTNFSKDPLGDSQELNTLIQGLMGSFGGGQGALAGTAPPGAGPGPVAGVQSVAAASSAAPMGGSTPMAAAAPMAASAPAGGPTLAGAPSPAQGPAGGPGGGPGGAGDDKESGGLSGLVKLAEVFGKVAGSALKGLMSAFGGGGGAGPKPG